MIVTHAHFRTIPGFSSKPGFCNRQGRVWFKRHGLSWSEFIRHGIDSEILLAIGDHFCLSMIEHAQKTEAKRG